MRTLRNGRVASGGAAVRPVNKGGTGGTTPVTACKALGAIHFSNVGLPGGIASKDESNRIPSDQIPAQFQKIADTINVDGPKELLKNTTQTYKITNYDIATQYIITPIKGAISVNKDEITYSAPNVSGKYGFVINDSTINVEIYEPIVSKPTITSPVFNAINRDIHVLLTASPFSIEGGTGAHQSSTWQIATDPLFMNIFDQSVKDTQNKTSYMNATPFSVNMTYYARVRYFDINIGNSRWSEVVAFHTKSLFLPNSEQAKLNPYNQEYTDGYGWVFEISADGNTLFASCERGTAMGMAQAGIIYVFYRSKGVWVYSNSISASNKSDGYKYGTSISTNAAGDILIVGSAGYSGNGLAASGCVYSYYKDTTGNWVEQPILLPNDRHKEARFSKAKVSGDGKTLVVAAYTQDNTSNLTAGALYVFTRANSYWTQTTKIEMVTTNNGMHYGEYGLDISFTGKYISVSSVNKIVSGQLNAGSVNIYALSANGWTLDTTIDNPFPTTDGQFGKSISFDYNGARLLIGAPGNIGPNSAGTGQAYLYFKLNGLWVNSYTLTDSTLLPGDQYGESVAISPLSDCIVVGAPGRPINGLGQSGSVFVYSKDTSGWVIASEVSASSDAARNGFGNRVKLSNDTKTLVVGSYGRNYVDTREFGSIYIFV